MPTVSIYYDISIPDAGLTLPLDSSKFVKRYIINMTQTGTMSGNTSITSDGADSKNSIYTIEFPGGVTLGAQTFTVFGVALTAAQALNKCLIVARWTGSAFTTQIYTDWASSNTVLLSHMTDNSVGTSELVDAGVTLAKMANLARGRIIVGDATARPAAVNLGGATAGSIPVADGTDVAIVAPSGDWTQNGAGVNVIGASKITTAKILDANVTWAKLQALARGSVLRGSSANVVEALSVSGAGAGAIVSTDATDVLAQIASGDISFDGALVGTISAGLNLYVAKVTIPTAQVLTLSSVPVTIVAAPGSGLAIEVISAAWKMTYAGVAYATNTSLRLMTLGATAAQAQDNVGLANANSMFQKIPLLGGGINDIDLVANQPLQVSVATGDPTAGTSDISVYVAYRIMEVA